MEMVDTAEVLPNCDLSSSKCTALELIQDLFSHHSSNDTMMAQRNTLPTNDSFQESDNGANSTNVSYILYNDFTEGTFSESSSQCLNEGIISHRGTSVSPTVLRAAGVSTEGLLIHQATQVNDVTNAEHEKGKEQFLLESESCEDLEALVQDYQNSICHLNRHFKSAVKMQDIIPSKEFMQGPRDPYTLSDGHTDTDHQELDRISEELFDICLDLELQERKMQDQIECSKANMAQQGKTQAASLLFLVQEFKNIYFQLSQLHQAIVEKEDPSIDVSVDKFGIPLATYPKEGIIISTQEGSLQECQKLGWAIAKLGRNIQEDLEKRKEVDELNMTAMETKITKMNSGFSEALGRRDNRLEKLIQVNAEMKACIEDGKTEKLSMESIIISTNRENDKLQNEVDALREQLSTEKTAFQVQLENILEKGKFKEREIKNLKKDVNRKDNHIQEIQQEYEKTLVQKEAVLFSFNAAKMNCENYEACMEEMESFMNGIVEKIENLMKQIMVNETNEENHTDGIHMKDDMQERFEEANKVHLKDEDDPPRGNNVIFEDDIYDNNQASCFFSKQCEAQDERKPREANSLTSWRRDFSYARFYQLNNGLERAAIMLRGLQCKISHLEAENRSIQEENAILKGKMQENRRQQYVGCHLNKGENTTNDEVNFNCIFRFSLKTYFDTQDTKRLSVQLP